MSQRLMRLLKSRERYRRDGAKHLAADIRCDPRAAKNILAGHWPRAEHLRRIVAQFGKDACDALFGPDIDATRARLADEVSQLEQQLAAKRDALAATEGDGVRDAQGVGRLASRVSAGARP